MLSRLVVRVCILVALPILVVATPWSVIMGVMERKSIDFAGWKLVIEAFITGGER